MNISRYILRTVNLNDPIDGWEVDSSWWNVCTEQNCDLLLHELEVDSCALVLILLTVEFHEVGADFEWFERLVGESDLLTRWEEDEDLLLLVRLQEGEESVQLVIDVHDHGVVK